MLVDKWLPISHLTRNHAFAGTDLEKPVHAPCRTPAVSGNPVGHACVHSMANNLHTVLAKWCL